MLMANNNKLQLGPINNIILGIAVILLIVGYFIMAGNEIVISPVILTIAYGVLIPLGLLYKSKPKE